MERLWRPERLGRQRESTRPAQAVCGRFVPVDSLAFCFSSKTRARKGAEGATLAADEQAGAPGAPAAEADEKIGGTAPMKLDELGSYIREQRKRGEYSLRHLAKVAGVSNPYLSQIERGLRKPSAEILQAIARALKISAESLYIKAGILEEREELANLEVAILRDAWLNERQRAALLEIYRSFRQANEERMTAVQTGSRDPVGGVEPALPRPSGSEFVPAEDRPSTSGSASTSVRNGKGPRLEP